MESECKNCEFEFNTTIGTSWTDFTNQFKILSSEDFTGAGSGDAKCKKCGLEVNWEHENFIHEKLFLTPKKVL